MATKSEVRALQKSINENVAELNKHVGERIDSMGAARLVAYLATQIASDSKKLETLIPQLEEAGELA